MTDNLNSNEPVSADTDDLEAFTALAEGKRPEAKAQEEEVQPAVDVENDEDDDLGDNQPATDDDDAEEDEAEEDGPLDEEAPKPAKPKKQTAQERINELTAKLREAERKAAAAEAQKELNPLPKPTVPAPVESSLEEPDPEAVDDNGHPLYPLGDIDPNYVKALIKYNNELAIEEFQRRTEEQKEQARIELAKQAQQNEWASKVEQVKQEIPDFEAAVVNLESVFSGVDPAYSDYLATTIMQMENGPEVLYHLANNLDVAQDIVSKGAVKATIALGKLESEVSRPKQPPAKKLSSAPQPPPINKGTKGGTKVAPDTDNLDDFEKFYLTKQR